MTLLIMFAFADEQITSPEEAEVVVGLLRDAITQEPAAGIHAAKGPTAAAILSYCHLDENGQPIVSLDGDEPVDVASGV